MVHSRILTLFFVLTALVGCQIPPPPPVHIGSGKDIAVVGRLSDRILLYERGYLGDSERLLRVNWNLNLDATEGLAAALSKKHDVQVVKDGEAIPNNVDYVLEIREGDCRPGVVRTHFTGLNLAGLGLLQAGTVGGSTNHSAFVCVLLALKDARTQSLVTSRLLENQYGSLPRERRDTLLALNGGGDPVEDFDHPSSEMLEWLETQLRLSLNDSIDLTVERMFP